ncbi:alpha/beta hydrolase [Nocardia puris]|uniref:Putative membrane protein n=1 Tax=Nocardia puris TaxID=208602 RepID=A0A366DC39_9NOCA|nr:alpha/beta-hydrolase family protein [Nocardia puris]MBF6211805.1 alpha/beta hydrolase [Nocardia puris]MBF6365808.1 alpha/beta hydrolase [Nocardia puris]MBF6460549.1 alpha/beta hydrolase [Nocardia puris]RBO86984.1 putative membrane protein [Nocardia puris]
MATAELRDRFARLGGRFARWFHPDYPGLVVATLFFCWSLTPSLLPRDWLFAGLVSGVNAAIGYGVGCLLHWAYRRWVAPKVRLPASVEERIAARPGWLVPVAKGALVAVCALAAVLVMIRSAYWQREITALMDMEPTTTSGFLRTGLLSAAVCALVIGLARGLRWLVRWVTNQLVRWVKIPRRVALPIGVVTVVVLALLLGNGVLVRVFFDVANSAFSVRNSNTSPNAVPPIQPERSGSPASLAAWDTLGSEGRWFVSYAPGAETIQQVTGRPAREPIRVYTGLESADGMEAQAELAVAELERTKAFEREVLVVVTTTGTGWVDSTSVESIELMFDGDTAVVATQYSYLPSALSFLSDKEKATESGRLVFDKVHERWSALPPESRPKLLVYGESLGSQGSEGAFSGLADLRARTDGVLWVGPPNSNRLWREFVTRRDPGSPEVLPIYADGLVVRFADARADLWSTGQTWLNPRVVYLQHASDPVVWWSPDLLFTEPDWLREPRGPDVTPTMTWYPIVTFWQVAADLPNAQRVADGHGHRYGTLVLDAWAAIADPPGWSEELAERVRAYLEESADRERELK